MPPASLAGCKAMAMLHTLLCNAAAAFIASLAGGVGGCAHSLAVFGAGARNTHLR